MSHRKAIAFPSGDHAGREGYLIAAIRSMVMLRVHARLLGGKQLLRLAGLERRLELHRHRHERGALEEKQFVAAAAPLRPDPSDHRHLPMIGSRRKAHDVYFPTSRFIRGIREVAAVGRETRERFLRLTDGNGPRCTVALDAQVENVARSCLRILGVKDDVLSVRRPARSEIVQFGVARQLLVLSRSVSGPDEDIAKTVSIREVSNASSVG